MSTPVESPGLRPETPDIDSVFRRPPLNRSSSSLSGLISKGADRVGEEYGLGDLPLLDVIETFFDSRLDLWERRLKEQSSRLRKRAGELIPKGLRTPRGHILLLDSDDDEAASPSQKNAARYKADMERELSRMKVKVAQKINHLSSTWRSAKTVRTREKASFVLGVVILAFTCLCYGMWPTWLPIAYTILFAVFIPIRIYTYKRKEWHYFLFVGLQGYLLLTFSMCYYVNILDLLWLWVFPSSTVLLICCYLLTMGPLMSAIITWRNSLVFHSIDKVTSLFIHIYPPIVFDIILFRWPGSEKRYPGIAGISNYPWYTMILMAAVPYCIWQGLYFKFISIDRKAKIESGARQNSFQHLLHDKRGPIGRALRGVPAAHRELWFIFGQLIYSILFMIPAATLLIHSSTAMAISLIVVFCVATWNGASFYVEVFGRKFERELESLRREMEQMSATQSSVATPSVPGTPFNAPNESALDHSPLVLPESEHASEVPVMSLDKEKSINTTTTAIKPKVE